ncbi:hypothetical protein ACET3Z_027618 [Daucus carota]
MGVHKKESAAKSLRVLSLPIKLKSVSAEKTSGCLSRRTWRRITTRYNSSFFLYTGGYLNGRPSQFE